MTEDPTALLARKEEQRKVKRERLLRQMRRPGVDMLQGAEGTTDYQVQVDRQIIELKTILAQDYITIDQKAIERAFKFPHFDRTATDGKYPEPGVGLMHNEYPKEKKKPKDKETKKDSHIVARHAGASANTLSFLSEY